MEAATVQHEIAVWYATTHTTVAYTVAATVHNTVAYTVVAVVQHEAHAAIHTVLPRGNVTIPHECSNPGHDST